MAQNRPSRGRDNIPAPAPKPAVMTYPDIAAEHGIEKPLWFALRNLYPGAQDQSIVMVHEYCMVRKLDPLKRPVHIVPMYVTDTLTGKGEMRDVIMPGIQEMRTTAARTSQYAGQDPVKLGPVIDVPVTNAESAPADVNLLKVPQWAEVTVYRLVGGKRYPFSHTEYFLEAVARKRNGLINEMWQKRSIGQLTKCAEAGALRKAFPEELGGEYAAEELEGQHDDKLADLVAVVEHGASGIPEPETDEPGTQQDEGADAASPEPEAKPPVDTKPKEEPEPEAKPEPKPEKAKAKAKPEPEPDVGELVIDLPAGALSVLQSKMAIKEVSEKQLLAKIGANITVKNINQALAAVSGWDE